MPDLTFLEKLPVSLQILLGLPFAYLGYLMFAKGIKDKLFLPPPPAIDAGEALRQRWEGPVTKHLEFMEQIAEGFGGRRDVFERIESVRDQANDRIEKLEGRVRDCERMLDQRLPPRR